MQLYRGCHIDVIISPIHIADNLKENNQSPTINSLTSKINELQRPTTNNNKINSLLIQQRNREIDKMKPY